MKCYENVKGLPAWEIWSEMKESLAGLDAVYIRSLLASLFREGLAYLRVVGVVAAAVNVQRKEPVPHLRNRPR